MKTRTKFLFLLVIIIGMLTFANTIYCMAQITAKQWNKDVVGWNLGNQFECSAPGQDGESMAIGNPELSIKAETAWGNPVVTKKVIKAVKDAGFNAIRIPIRWQCHISNAQAMSIDKAWMKRIRQVAQWVVDEGMYFIINIHHDNSKKYLYPDSHHYEQSDKYVAAIWSQVADAFADFDDHCIFESMNEPRLVGSTYEWWLNTSAAECRDAAECINRLNQKFVDTVRSKGGNNASRYLLVPGYCASPDGALTDLFRLPDDPAENRIMVEVHAYTPYDYALNKANPDSSFDLDKDRQKKQDISSFMNRLYSKYISQGIPVIIDEFGALKKNDDDLQDRVNFTCYYTASASARGITCVWWDNHGFSASGERFGLINRNKKIWVYPDIAIAMIENCTFNRK